MALPRGAMELSAVLFPDHTHLLFLLAQTKFQTNSSI